MADMILLCPLCCDKVFNSKLELIEHLRSIYENIVCPICNEKFPSVGHLIEHLQHNNCEPENAVAVVQFDMSNVNENKKCVVQNFVSNEETESSMIPVDEVRKELADPFASNITDRTEESGELGRMYVELLSKQLAKPRLQTQELKLVEDGGVSRYVILSDETPNMDDGSAIVTKQNNDGTISLTTVRDMKIEAESMLTEQSPESEETAEEEVYSCNTCGVSFTSVLDHIQNYHNNQDVVVEEPMDGSNQGEATEYEFEIPLEDSVNDKQTSRRMITETGDIIETPMMLQTTSMAIDKKLISTKPVQTVAKSKAAQKEPKQRRFAVLNKFCDSVVKNIANPDEKNGPFHKVVIKEMQTNNGDKLKVFNCISCNVYVSTLEEFKSHPCKVLKYTCTHCSVSYENAKSLCAHMKVHKNKNTTVGPNPLDQYQCEYCSTTFVTHKSLKLHKRMHDPVKVRPIEPPVENADGSEASTDTYLCGQCDKIIPIDYRSIHQESHKQLEKFNCDICNKKFTSGEYLEMHMTVHSTEKVSVNKQDKFHPYTCLYCDRRFARPHEKVKHERIHTGEKPHSCEICGKSFRVSYCLTLHMRTHTGARPYSCPHCGKRFKAHSVYNHHLLTHSDVRAYKCPYCPKAFKTSVQLAGHKNSHTKPFSCQHCNRPFASLYAVRVHTETHSRQNNLKFSCSMCGASYARAFALKDHMKQVHDRDPDYPERLPSLKGESGWISSETPAADAEELSKQLPHEVEIGELGIMNSNELIVP